MSKKKQKQKQKQKQKLITKTNSLPKMCLCMIVKNEAHVIEETLNNILKYIDYWVIADTGSTDGTQEIIKNFFKQKNISGELVEHEWKNFGHNRTLAFQAAYGKSEYVWVIDADDLLVGNLVLPKNLTSDGYLLNYGNEFFTYGRTQIFNNKLKWCYRGILHEFSKCLDKEIPQLTRLEGNYYVNSRRLGDRNKDPLKYLKDAELLINAVENNIDKDLHTRYYFYIGQSYRDYKDFSNAIKYFELRTNMGGWIEEIYVSYMEMGLAMIELKYDTEKIKETFINGFKTLSRRAECLYFLSKYYFEKNDLINAYKTCKIAVKINYPSDLLLFIKKDIHDFKTKELLYVIYLNIQLKKINIPNLTTEIINQEIKTLYNFLTTDKKVPKETKINIEKLSQEMETKSKLLELPNLENFIFINNVDSYGNDVAFFPDNTMNEMEDICDIFDTAICFNTYGYLKNIINTPLIILPNKKYMNDGLFIKKEIFNKITNKYGDKWFSETHKITIDDL